jgi:hypothetical protein
MADASSKAVLKEVVAVEEPLEQEKPVTIDAHIEATSEESSAAAPGDRSTATKKKKKKSYKNMMASMMNSSSSRDMDKEKDAAIRKVTGGGAFSKIDKI